jgi:hypothetical protein
MVPTVLMTQRRSTSMWDRAGGVSQGGTRMLNLPQDPPISLRFIQEVTIGEEEKWSNVELESDPSASGWIKSEDLKPLPSA